MKKATFEVATFADAVNKASRIAPYKGIPFDRAAGVVIEVDPATPETVIITSTDLQMTFRQEVSALEVGDEPATWRVPSKLLNSIMSTLPLVSGSTIVMAEKEPSDSYVYFKSGKTKAKLRTITGDYPLIDHIDPTKLQAVGNFARRMQQVAWATDKNAASVLGGIHINGTHLFGCDKQTMAMVPCAVPLDRPVTAPLSELSALIKNTSEVGLAATDTHLMLMPDAYTQMSSVLYASEYPKVETVINRVQYTETLNVSVDALTASLARMLILVKVERYPVTTIEIGDGVMRLEMEVPDVGKIDDEIEIAGGTQGTPFRVSFTPDNLIDAMKASGRPYVTFDYGPTPVSQMRIRDDNDFVAIIMPRTVAP